MAGAPAVTLDLEATWRTETLRRGWWNKKRKGVGMADGTLEPGTTAWVLFTWDRNKFMLHGGHFRPWLLAA